jgi:hypothetical protein
LPDRLSRDQDILFWVGHVYRLAHRYADARQALGSLGGMCSYACGALQMQRGELESAEIAFDEGDVPGACEHLRRIRSRWPAPTGHPRTLDRLRDLEKRCPAR